MSLFQSVCLQYVNEIQSHDEEKKNKLSQGHTSDSLLFISSMSTTPVSSHGFCCFIV